MSERAKFCSECGEKVIAANREESINEIDDQARLRKATERAEELAAVMEQKEETEPPVFPTVEVIKNKPDVEAQGFAMPPKRAAVTPPRKDITPPPPRKPLVNPPPIRKPATGDTFTPPPTKKTKRTSYTAPVKKEAKRVKVKDPYYDPVKPDDADKEEEKEKIDTKKNGYGYRYCGRCAYN